MEPGQNQDFYAWTKCRTGVRFALSFFGAAFNLDDFWSNLFEGQHLVLCQPCHFQLILFSFQPFKFGLLTCDQPFDMHSFGMLVYHLLG